MEEENFNEEDMGEEPTGSEEQSNALREEEEELHFTQHASQTFDDKKKKHRKQGPTLPTRRQAEPEDGGEEREHGGRFKCEQCFWGFPVPAKLKRHLLRHERPGQYVCQLCHVAFKHNYNAKEHWRSNCQALQHVRQEFEFKHTECEDLTEIVRSELILNGEVMFLLYKGIQFQPDPVPQYNETNMLQWRKDCVLCGLSIPLIYEIMHFDAHRGAVPVDGKTNGAPHYMCHLCGDLFSDNEDLYHHYNNDCDEFMAYYENGKLLPKDEIAKRVYFLLQCSVPYEVSKNFLMEKMERWDGIAVRIGMNRKNPIVHFPYQILPYRVEILQTRSELLDMPLLTAENKKLHPRVNWLALAVPAIYSSGRNVRDVNQMETYILNYKKFEHVHEITDELLDTATNDTLWMHRESPSLSCLKCKIVFASEGKLKRHNLLKHIFGESRCAVCHDQKQKNINTMFQLRPHFENCPTLKELLWSREEIKRWSYTEILIFLYHLTKLSHPIDKKTFEEQLKHIDSDFSPEEIQQLSHKKRISRYFAALIRIRKSREQMSDTNNDCVLCDDQPKTLSSLSSHYVSVHGIPQVDTVYQIPYQDAMATDTYYDLQAYFDNLIMNAPSFAYHDEHHAIPQKRYAALPNASLGKSRFNRVTRTSKRKDYGFNQSGPLVPESLRIKKYGLWKGSVGTLKQLPPRLEITPFPDGTNFVQKQLRAHCLPTSTDHNLYLYSSERTFIKMRNLPIGAENQRTILDYIYVVTESEYLETYKVIDGRPSVNGNISLNDETYFPLTGEWEAERRIENSSVLYSRLELIAKKYLSGNTALSRSINKNESFDRQRGAKHFVQEKTVGVAHNDNLAEPFPGYAANYHRLNFDETN